MKTRIKFQVIVPGEESTTNIHAVILGINYFRIYSTSYLLLKSGMRRQNLPKLTEIQLHRSNSTVRAAAGKVVLVGRAGFGNVWLL